MSRGFIASLTGLAMTLFAWYGPWEWPAWPAFTLIDLAFGRAGFAEYPFGTKALIVVVLIIVNTGSWGLLALMAMAACARVVRSGDARP